MDANECRLCGTPHNRHTCASILQSAGVPIDRISKKLGHRNVVVTQAIYAHVFHTDTANFMDTVAAPPATTKATVPRFREA